MSSSTKTGKALAHRIAVANRAHAISGVLLNIGIAAVAVAVICAIFTALANPVAAGLAAAAAVAYLAAVAVAAVAAVAVAAAQAAAEGGKDAQTLAVGVVALDIVAVAFAVAVGGWVVGALAAVGLVVVAGAYVYKRGTAREAAPGKEAVEALMAVAVEDAGNVVEAQLGAQGAKSVGGAGGGGGYRCYW